MKNITWTKGSMVDDHDQLKEYECTGVDKSGKRFTGTWIEIHGQFEEVTNVEGE